MPVALLIVVVKILKRLVYVFLGISIITILLSAGLIHSANKKSLKPEGLRTQAVQPENLQTKGSAQAKLESGPITEVPWEKNENFKAALKDNQDYVMMAAYRTVLHDPLPGEENNVHLGARLLAGKVVQPGEIFSQNNAIGPYSSARGFQKGPVYLGSQLSTTIGGGVCKISSTLYNVAVLCNLPVIERHSHGMPVPYVPYGQDATVSYGVKDFKFQNNMDFPLLIWSQGIGNTLYIGFYGKNKPPRVEWHHEFIKKINTWKIYRHNPSLPLNTEKVVLQGMDGAVVRSWVIINDAHGIHKKSLGKSYYSPMPSIIEKGT